MNKLVWIIIILIILIGVYFLSYTESAIDKPLKIGVILGTTGQYAWVGENYLKGIALAEEKYERKNPGVEIDLVVEDDEFDPKKGLSAYEKLINLDNVDALINETSSTIDVIYDKVVSLGIPLVQGGEQTIDAKDDNIFQIQPGYYVAEVALGENVRKKDSENVVMFTQNYPAMLKLAKGFREGYGSEEIEEHKINPGEKDMGSYAVKVRESGADVVVILMFPDDGALLTKKIVELVEPDPYFIFDANFQSGINNYKKILGDITVLDESNVMVVNMETNEEFKKEYQERFGEDAGLGSDWGYDALNVLLLSYDSEYENWNKNLRSFSYEGASGYVEFDNVGVRIPNYEIKKLKNGKFVEVK